MCYLKSHTASYIAFLDTSHDLKLGLLLSIIMMSLFTSVANGQETNEFGYRLLPNKIVEHTDGILEVYMIKDGIVTPAKIANSIVTSSDSSIIKILEIENEQDDFITKVKIMALNMGTTNIALAAPGFSSQEFPITVYDDTHNPSKLLIKTNPNIFSVNGPKAGYVSVELADGNGIPTPASEDTIVTLTTSKNDIIDLKNNELVITKGEYFAVGEFKVNNSGEALIYASSQNMETVNSVVTTNEVAQPLTVHLYVYPNIINSFSASYAYAIVQLQDLDGNPIKAGENIPVSLKITRSEQDDQINTSENRYVDVVSDGSLEIKKDSYWGYTPLSTRAGLEDLYNISISAKNYLVSSPVQLNTTNIDFMDEKSAKLDVLPIQATGKEELVGIVHLEDENGNPVAANKNLKIQIDSSDETLLSINDIRIGKGFGVSPIFGKTGYVKSDDLPLNIISENGQAGTVKISGPEKESLKLVAEPIISKVLSNTNFPIIVYLTDENGAISYFPEEMGLSVFPNEFVKVETKIIHEGQSPILLDAMAAKEGSTTLSFDTGNFESNAKIDILSSEPESVLLDSPNTLFINLKNTFSVQLLDKQQSPIFANKDMEIKLVSNDPSIVDTVENIIIKKGDYYALFDVKANKIGETELAALLSELPLSKVDIKADAISPNMYLSSVDNVNPDTPFDVTLTAQYLNSPLKKMSVVWDVNGATIQKMDSATDETGKATISLLAQDQNKVYVDAKVSDKVFQVITVKKQINVNQPLSSSPVSTHDANSMILFGMNPIFIVIPVVAVVGIVLKKKNMLDGITEKLSFTERILEVKERIVQLRSR